MTAVYAGEIRKGGGTEQKQMGRGKCASVSRLELRDRREKAVRKASGETMENGEFDQGGLQEGAVSWEGIGRPCFCQGNSYQGRALDLRTLSTSTTWKVLVSSNCHIDTCRSALNVVRNLTMRGANGSWARGVEEGAGVVAEGAGDVGGLRPATNITGANWARSSMGYEFMVAVRH